MSDDIELASGEYVAIQDTVVEALERTQTELIAAAQPWNASSET